MPPALASADDLAHALQAAREHFAPEMQRAMRDIRGLLAGRDPRQLVGRECVAHLELRAKFYAVADAQAAYAEAQLAQRSQRLAA